MTSSRAIVEHDFFRLERINSHQNSNFRGIQSAITRLDPNIVRSVMGIPPGPPLRTVAPPVPAFNPASMPVNERLPAAAPLTIFYNGAVTVFHMEPDAAESIMKLAKEASINAKERLSNNGLDGGLSMARRVSLNRFLAKRKQRLLVDASDAEKNEEESTAMKKSRSEFM